MEVYRIPLNKNDPSKNTGFMGDSLAPLAEGQRPIVMAW